MPTRPPTEDPDDAGMEVSAPGRRAAGPAAVRSSLRQARTHLGVARGARVLLKVNQPDGFDCPGCAWPEPGDRSHAEFCENGVKALAEEATVRRITADFWRDHDITALMERSDHWLGQQGRLTEPVLRRPGSDHYEPIGWDEALDLVADRLAGLPAPDRAAFYTSGRASNEAAFLYQLFVRALGTNNLPDCSNMCHESSGVALKETIGVGKASVTVDDLESADVILVVGQNPGTNHPRMLSTLERAKRNGATIVAVNPLPEAGLLAFDNPQHLAGWMGRGTALADHFLQIRVGGDQALFQALGRLLLEAEDDAPGTVMDRTFIAAHTAGFEDWADAVRRVPWPRVLEATGLTEAEIRSLGDVLARSRATIVCWAMGLTQHRHSVATIRDVVNVLLLRGHIGRPGAGVCPVRGHSNVQGDRTMGIWEQPTEAFLAPLEAEFDVPMPREPGFSVVEAIEAMVRGEVDVFLALGGNFASATPDSAATWAALSRVGLTVQVSTKLNRSHLVTGEWALILPCLGRTERDATEAGPQFVTVEDSMGWVHASRGTLDPAAPGLRSEPRIICDLAERTFARLGPDHPGGTIPWADLAADYRLIRERIARTIAGFEHFEERVGVPGGFLLPHAPRDERRFTTDNGRANFTVNPLHVIEVPPGRLLLQTVRSHDQFNTTVYGRDDRYRGIRGGRRVVFVHEADLAELGRSDGDLVDLVSEWADGVERRAERFRLVAYPTARGCAAAYFPETNVLVPLGSVADQSRTPTSKSVVIRLEDPTPG